MASGDAQGPVEQGVIDVLKRVGGTGGRRGAWFLVLGSGFRSTALGSTSSPQAGQAEFRVELRL